MNPFQDAIAKVTGLDELIEAQESRLGEFETVAEQLIADNHMMQRQLEDLDYLNLFEMNEIAEVLPYQDRKKVIQRLRRLRHDNPLAKQAVKLIIRFTLGRGVQWVLTENKPDVKSQPTPTVAPDQPSGRGILPTKFEAQELLTLTSGGSPEIAADNDPTRKICESFWEDDDNKLAFTSHKSMQQMLDEVVTDGEKFHAAFEAPSAPYIKVSEIPVEEIVQIIYDPNNLLRPVYYKRQFVEKIYDGKSDMYKPASDPKVRYYLDYRITDEMLAGDADHPGLDKTILIPKSKIADARVKHTSINELWTKGGKRGISELYASREWFRVFREFMEGRAAINQAAQAISYTRKVKGGPSVVASFQGKFGGLKVSQPATDESPEVQKLTRPIPAAVYDSNEAVDLSWMKTDTGAQNAKEDAHMLLATGGAGVGTMVHYFGEGGDANLATAQAMELPMVKTYEDWQQFVEEFFRSWFEYLLTVATDADSAKQEIKRVGFVFPPIVSQDITKQTTSWAQIVRDIAPNNIPVREQAIRSVLAVMKVPNIDGLMAEIKQAMVQAEQQRLKTAADMAALAHQAVTNPPQPPQPGPNGNGNNAPPGGITPRVPNDALPPGLKKLAAGKGDITANGPKRA